MRYFIFIFNGRGGNGVIFVKSAGYKGHCNKGGRTIPRAFKAEGKHRPMVRQQCSIVCTTRQTEARGKAVDVSFFSWLINLGKKTPKLLKFT